MQRPGPSGVPAHPASPSPRVPSEGRSSSQLPSGNRVMGCPPSGRSGSAPADGCSLHADGRRRARPVRRRARSPPRSETEPP
ncbi:hypothetical protein ATKI12_4827 [Kitasatospora sp. Ki12]